MAGALRTVVLILITACGGATGASQPNDAGTSAPDAPADATGSGLSDAVAEASAETSGESDAPDGGATGTVYHDITDGSFWVTFDATKVDPNARDFAGGAFDGRYVYLSPSQYRVALRYDTSAQFNSSNSWSAYDVSAVNPDPVGFHGAAFDGRYVYFVPGYAGTYGSHVTRYDTQLGFTAPSAWTAFDTTTADPSAKGFAGAVFDGRYLYFVPNSNLGVVARFDTQGNFTTASSWSTFGAVSPGIGGVFDGRYTYLLGDRIDRYDTQASFQGTSSWSTITPPSTLNGSNYVGGGFDGRYLYLAPANDHHGEVTRCDTQGLSSDAASSWDTFNLGGNFSGVGFDGRYVYLEPQDHGVSRYDTEAVFGASSSWSTYAPLSTFVGAIFDGRYMYFAPSADGTVARFDAKTPPSLPKLPGWTGSFL